jgi:hypothetical protein
MGTSPLPQQIPCASESPAPINPLLQQIPYPYESPPGANAQVFHRPMGTNPLRFIFPYGLYSLTGTRDRLQRRLREA